MILVLLGGTASGKTKIEEVLREQYGFKSAVSYTTRKPREEEINGVHYHFINNTQFMRMVDCEEMVEWDEYSQGRKYGTTAQSYLAGGDIVAVLTPNGFRQLKKSLPNEKIYSVLVEANLGTRIKRYVDRCGVDKFNFDDKNEICSRVERDFGMFKGVENEVDLVVHNDEGQDMSKVVGAIINMIINKRTTEELE